VSCSLQLECRSIKKTREFWRTSPLLVDSPHYFLEQMTNTAFYQPRRTNQSRAGKISKIRRPTHLHKIKKIKIYWDKKIAFVQDGDRPPSDLASFTVCTYNLWNYIINLSGLCDIRDQTSRERIRLFFLVLALSWKTKKNHELEDIWIEWILRKLNLKLSTTQVWIILKLYRYSDKTKRSSFNGEDTTHMSSTFYKGKI